MTKKSNNRKFKLGEPPTRYRELILDIPMPMYERVLKNQAAVTKKGLIPATMTPREFVLILLANGIGLAEADLHKRERETSLVVTPQEAAEMAARMPKRG